MHPRERKPGRKSKSRRVGPRKVSSSFKGKRSGGFPVREEEEEEEEGERKEACWQKKSERLVISAISLFFLLAQLCGFAIFRTESFGNVRVNKRGLWIIVCNFFSFFVFFFFFTYIVNHLMYKVRHPLERLFFLFFFTRDIHSSKGYR